MNAQSGRHLVRPRWVWAGTSCAVAGMVVIGIGAAGRGWTWSLIGVAVLVVGGGVALRGGVLYDVHSGSPLQELGQVRRGEVRQGVAPGETRSSPASRRESRSVERQRRFLARAAIEAPRPALVGPAGALLLLVAAFLVVSQWSLYPSELPGQSNANRALGCAIVLALAGLRVLTAQPSSPHHISGALALAAALALFLNGVLAPHDREVVAVAACACGLLSAVAATIVLTHRPAPPPAGRRIATGRTSGSSGVSTHGAAPTGTCYPGAPESPVALGTATNAPTGVTVVAPGGVAPVTGVERTDDA